MARLRPMKMVNVLTFDEKTRVTHFFMLLVEIDVRLPKTAKTKAKKRTTKKVNHKPTSPRLLRPRPIKNKPCYIKCPAMCCTSSPAQRDLFLNPFARIFNTNATHSSMGYTNDRHHRFIAYT